VVAVTTGAYKDAGIDNGIVSINLIGVNGDTGVRELNGAISKNVSLWQPGQMDIFILEAVSVGKLKKVEVTCTTSAQGEIFQIIMLCECYFKCQLLFKLYFFLLVTLQYCLSVVVLSVI